MHQQFQQNNNNNSVQGYQNSLLKKFKKLDINEIDLTEEMEDINTESDLDENQNQQYKESHQHVLFRTAEGVFYQRFDQDLPEKKTAIDIKNKFAFFSKDGKYIIIADSSVLSLYSIKHKCIVRQVNRANMQILEFSKSCKFLITVQMKDKNNYSCYILDPITFEEIQEIQLDNYTRFQWPMVQFDEKDTLIFIKSKQNIEIKDTAQFLPIAIIQLDEDYETLLYISPKRQNLQFVLVQPESTNKQGEGVKGQIKLFDFQKSMEKPIFQQELKKAQDIKPIWSPDGKNILVHVSTMHDNTNQSYYGQHKVKNKNQEKQLYTKGPIYDIKWNHSSTYFVVSCGYMPAGTVLFNKEGFPEFEFGRHHKNFVQWAKERFLLIAGFGNLNGDIEIWDVEKFEKVGQCRAHTTVSCVWSPCSRKFMVGVLNPRLRQDNKMQVFKYDGSLIKKVDYSQSELYEVLWRPESYQYENRPASPKKIQNNEGKPAAKPTSFLSRGGGEFAAQLRANKSEQFSGPRKLEPDEKFNSLEPDSTTSQGSDKEGKQKKYSDESNNEGDNNGNGKKNFKKETKSTFLITRADPNKPKIPIQIQEDLDPQLQNKKKKKATNNNKKDTNNNGQNNDGSNDQKSKEQKQENGNNKPKPLRYKGKKHNKNMSDRLIG